MILLDIALYSLYAFTGLFMYYIILMEAIRIYGRTKAVIAMACVFWFFDWLVNVFIISVWFLQLPHKPFQLVTGRLKQWRKDYEYQSYRDLTLLERKRMLFAVYICDRHLDKYDVITGDHC